MKKSLNGLNQQWVLFRCPEVFFLTIMTVAAGAFFWNFYSATISDQEHFKLHFFHFWLCSPTALLVLSPSHSINHWQKALCLSFPEKTKRLVYFYWHIFKCKKSKKVCALLKIKINILLITWERVEILQKFYRFWVCQSP